MLQNIEKLARVERETCSTIIFIDVTSFPKILNLCSNIMYERFQFCRLYCFIVGQTVSQLDKQFHTFEIFLLKIIFVVVNYSSSIIKTINKKPRFLFSSRHVRAYKKTVDFDEYVT